MPLYEYECDACRHRFELIQKFSDPLAEKCPSCGGTVQKLQSAPAIQFKGAGFYITDYRSEGYKEAAKKESGAASGAEAKGAPAGETKSATAKSESKSAPKPAKEPK